MKKINPLYIVVLLIMLFIFVEYNLHRSKQELEQNFQLFQKNKQLAVKLDALREGYSSKHIAEFLHILRSDRFKDAKFKIKREGNSLRIVSKNISLDDLNYLFSKILNGNFPIFSFRLTRLSAEKASMVLELKW
jgi:hypothetical protein